MPSSQDSLIHEASSLFRLVESIDLFVTENENLYAYREATLEFFSHIHDRASQTKDWAKGLIADVDQKSTEAGIRDNSELLIRKNTWRTLHTYIKPAADAHTLNLPTSLIDLATGHLRLISGMEATAIVVLLTPELMYYENTPQTPQLGLPAHLVFLEIPYSQGPGFFVNLAIYHELAHFVFDRLPDSPKLPRSFTVLTEELESAFSKHLGTLSKPSTITWAKTVLTRWTKEIFCDLFAARHIGPAFSFALIDILSLLGLMQGDTATTFTNAHPAPAMRFREQLDRMQGDGWWPTVAEIQSEHVSLIKRLAGLDKAIYTFEHNETAVPAFVDAFLGVIPCIHSLILEITDHLNLASSDFNSRRQDIEECLLYGVVPSQLLDERYTSSPTPVSIINAGYCVYLYRLPEVMGKLENQDPYRLDQRGALIQKLEAWTLKAIEDYGLLVASANGDCHDN